MVNNSENNDINSNDINTTNEEHEEFERIEEFEENNLLRPSGVNTYIKKEDNYQDLKSTGILFIIVSILGVIYLILNMAGVIPFVSGLFSYLVLGALFLVFLYIGISTYRKANQVSLGINAENAQTKEINDWLLNNITKDNIDQFLDKKHYEQEEVYYLKLIEKIKELIKNEFIDLDDNYLDVIVEEYYDEHLE